MDIKEKILYELEETDYVREIHKRIKEGLVGSMRSEYILSNIGHEPKKEEERIEKMMTPIFHAIVDMMTAYLLHTTGKDYIQLIMDTPTFKTLIDKELSNDELAMYIGYINGAETLTEKMKMLNKIINKEMA